AGTIFFLFPRLNSIALSLNFDTARRKTGYSGSVFLTGGGQIEEGTALAFRATSTNSAWLEKNSSDLYFRGQVLEKYDRGKWDVMTDDLYKDYSSGINLQLLQNVSQTFQNIQVIYEPLLNKQIL